MFLKLAGQLKKKHTAIYIQLHTGHVPLNKHLYLVFKSPVERLQKDWQLDWTDKGCNWTAVAGCMVLGEVHRVVQDQLQLVAIETGLYRGRGIFYMRTEVFVDILYAKNTDK